MFQNSLRKILKITLQSLPLTTKCGHIQELLPLPLQKSLLIVNTRKISFKNRFLINYREAVDMWSAGVVLYTMLCGYQPFQSETVEDLIEQIKEAKYEFHSDPWDDISSQAKDLIRCLLNINHRTRYTPFQALMHPWIANVSYL